MEYLLEVRTYRLKPGATASFDEAMHKLAVPMIRQAGMDVVAYGLSDHEEETYFLIRAYRNREALQVEQDSFYNTEEWKDGPRPLLVESIETYLNTLLWASSEAVQSLRSQNAQTHRV